MDKYHFPQYLDGYLAQWTRTLRQQGQFINILDALCKAFTKSFGNYKDDSNIDLSEEKAGNTRTEQCERKF